jgi:putative redox protein
MECTVNWIDPGSHTQLVHMTLAETGSGHTLVMDGAPDAAKT